MRLNKRIVVLSLIMSVCVAACGVIFNPVSAFAGASVSLTPGAPDSTWAIGVKGGSAVTAKGNTWTVTHDSGGGAETLKIGVTSDGGWTPGSTPALNQFVLKLGGTPTYSSGSGADVNTVITSDTILVTDLLNNGTAVFGLSLTTPSSGNEGLHTLTVTLTATDWQPWPDASWLYRRPITITGSTAGSQTDYQVKITVSHDSDMQADFDDIRFTDSSGTTLRDYWRESYTASTTASFWVEVPSIPASPNTTTIYAYYGNASVGSVSNGAGTFMFFDDFEAQSVGSAPDASKWTVCVIEPGDFEQVKLDPVDSSNKVLQSYAYGNPAGFSEGYARTVTANPAWGSCAIHYKFRISGNLTFQATFVNWGCSGTAGSFYEGGLYYVSNPIQYYNGSIWITTGPNVVMNTWYNMELRPLSSSPTILMDGTSASIGYFASWSSPTNFTVPHYGADETDRSTYVDNVRVRKYASPEPTVGAVGTEEPAY